MKEINNETKNLLYFEKDLKDLYQKITELQKLSEKEDLNLEEEIRMVKKRIDTMRQEIFNKLEPQQIVQVARHIMRPSTLDYINFIFEDFIELHGDRNFGDDKAIVCGIAKLNGQSIVIIGHQKGHTTKELINRNFGMAHPEGYRKALRIMRMAVRANKPIISFIDTPGAYPGIGAEERGQSEAIAKNLREMSIFTVPFISIITGEGGSGGALGISMGNRVLMMEYSIYAVISPEGCASILFRDSSRANEAAKVSKITAKDLLGFGIIDEIIKEPIGGAHNDYEATAKNIKTAILKNLNELSKFSPRELVADRYNKYRKMGIFTE
ncbi:acetyl-CoA carboxylase carboxyltransferase subunit alpha [candidate division WOR-1 bacterium RIFOXYA2_FULL_36_21]|uniref:Acetyl-coenzyme A carboxylase carboxyl transferase subunit alpha n=1 Tax=candidate division WOR-1 bacterium RIFOXYB2_FULL_36_35 TaxID=1802578 RepID=A0A1F4S7B8_UNCSA|nr:MAG: acetyl-CoA carboxylase carboxyltransferase subunit alpha [candidate division WOR-1 bacterium RIFOXYA2_FULL_36_21]OGC15701.1 MAG: acetyl-CoA carboxylase carboxyltransferase subunit alpha [candidate division WOR-1 bacterium RIFOXYA12_FULL_36_13]OGC16301.1 MAG: acetyl-CoA carboxylase carboxyltransferase subunit alpha [candidate division WOR-1 bacterium RIFOXYB2_FULL_36_35]